MSLQVMKNETDLLTDSLQTFHNGFTGGSYETSFYIKNVFPEYYYEDITLKVVMSGELEEGSLFSETGWSIKLHKGSTSLSEQEWGDVILNQEIDLGSLGSSEVADTETLIPVQVRVFCPGHSVPQLKDNMSLSLKYSKRLVGENG